MLEQFSVWRGTGVGGMSRWYAGAVVGLAAFLVGISLQRPALLKATAETEVADRSQSGAAPTGYADAAPLQRARAWLVSPDVLADADRLVGRSQFPLVPGQVAIAAGPANPRATTIRVFDSIASRSAAVADELARRFAERLNAEEKRDLESRRRQLVERTTEERGRIAAAEHSLSLLLADFRAALAQIPPPQPTPAAEATRPRELPELELMRPDDFATGAAPTSPAPTPPPMQSQAQPNPEWVVLHGRVDEIRAELAALLVKYTEQNPRVQIARLQLQQLERQLERLPQFLSTAPAAPSRSAIRPRPQSDDPPATNAEELPIARGASVRRTAAEESIADSRTPDLQRYLDEFATINQQLEASRTQLTSAERELARFEQFAGMFPAERFAPAGPARLVGREYVLPANAIGWTAFGALLLGGAFAFVAVHPQVGRLQSHADLAASIGLPVVATLHRAGARSELPERDQQDQQRVRYAIAGAEFAIGVIITFFFVSRYLDADFARIAAGDPLTALSLLWHRG